mmetsp:Transcript_16192/g.42057  ORF Transcript_16192/g.42057 Transcript_16192/m.42057 type:complete len:169 (+) Transcript_16192:169-675(+)
MAAAAILPAARGAKGLLPHGVLTARGSASLGSILHAAGCVNPSPENSGLHPQPALPYTPQPTAAPETLLGPASGSIADSLPPWRAGEWQCIPPGGPPSAADVLAVYKAGVSQHLLGLLAERPDIGLPLTPQPATGPLRADSVKRKRKKKMNKHKQRKRRRRDRRLKKK